MDKSRYEAYLKAVEKLSAEYQAGYRMGLEAYATDNPAAAPARTAPADTRKGYRDGVAGKAPAGFHGGIGNKNATGVAGEVNDSHLHIRIPSSTKAGYVKAAQAEGMKLSEWVVTELDKGIARHKRRQKRAESQNSDAFLEQSQSK